jgi:AAA+ ATPase superfamily predicted ATPase
VEQLIDQKQYFVIHAARQSGKTTYLQDLARRLNATNKYYALYCSLEKAKDIIEPELGIPSIVRQIGNELEATDIPYRSDFTKDADYKNYTGVLQTSLIQFCRLLDKPLVILFDETDCLNEGTLNSFLSQLRDGYNSRPECAFPHSIALAGMHRIRNYKAKILPNGDYSFSNVVPFNIITETYTLQNFTKEEIIQLYSQHTGETGQIFEENAIELIREQTQGQPWLVNVIANEVIVEILQSDYTKPVTAELVNQAIQNIILRRDTHIDYLLEQLKEDRVHRIIEPMILGESMISKESDNFQYTLDLGLIRVDNYRIKPANPIYAEVIIRKLSSAIHRSLQNPEYPYQMSRYLKNGRIDMDYLLKDFQNFWRENSEIQVEKLDYPEAAPYLVLMGFLQRVVNSDGEVSREIASGSGRIDLCIKYGNQKYPIELTIRCEKKYTVKSLDQLARYMDTLGCNEGWLTVFDRRETIKWKSKIYTKKETVNGKSITIIGA